MTHASRSFRLLPAALLLLAAPALRAAPVDAGPAKPMAPAAADAGAAAPMAAFAADAGSTPADAGILPGAPGTVAPTGNCGGLPGCNQQGALPGSPVTPPTPVHTGPTPTPPTPAPPAAAPAPPPPPAPGSVAECTWGISKDMTDRLGAVVEKEFPRTGKCHYAGILTQKTVLDVNWSVDGQPRPPIHVSARRCMVSPPPGTDDFVVVIPPEFTAQCPEGASFAASFSKAVAGEKVIDGDRDNPRRKQQQRPYHLLALVVIVAILLIFWRRNQEKKSGGAPPPQGGS